jgi:hypothetical protein
MSQFNLRFYGRFVFTQARTNPESVQVLAVMPTFNSSIKARKHTVIMTVRQTSDLTATGSPQPNFRLMSGGPPSHSDHLVWRIEHANVTVCADGGFSWRDGNHDLLANLNDLSPKGTPINSDVLSARRDDRLVPSIIKLDAGVGTPKQLRTGLTYDLAPFGDPGHPTISNKHLADMVEVVLTVPTLILDFSSGGEAPPTTVELATKDLDPIAVSFSNLCTVSHTGPDTEFAGFYEIMKPPPPLEKRLIPVIHQDPLLQFPFGDCFTSGYFET